MTILTKTASTLAAAMLLALPAATAQADLSPADIDAIDGKSGIRVLSSDGALVGTTNGINVRGDRTRMFLLARQGSIFRLRGGGKDIVLTTFTDQLTLQGGNLVLDADERRVRIKANKSFTDDSAPIEILLLSRR